MSINHDHWKRSFISKFIPPWICPYCNIGVLNGEKSIIKISYSEATINDRSHPAHEPDWDKGVFEGNLLCPNSLCKEKTLIIGETKVEFERYFDESTQSGKTSQIDPLIPE